MDRILNTTPKRRRSRSKGKLQLPPKLTPLSDGSSSTVSPHKNNNNNNKSKQKQQQRSQSRQRRRSQHNGDRNILKGAALVRNKILKRQQDPREEELAQPNPLQMTRSFETNWSDPFGGDQKAQSRAPATHHHHQPQDISEEEEEEESGDSFSPAPALDGGIHWAQLALRERKETRKPYEAGYDRDTNHNEIRSPPETPRLLKKPIMIPFPRTHEAVIAAKSSTSSSSSSSHDRNFIDLTIPSFCEESFDSETDESANNSSHRSSNRDNNEQFISKQWGPSLPSPSAPAVSSPLTQQYQVLKKDPGYIHAQNAGYLWQTLVGQHVRFPSLWYDGARSPQMGVDEETTPSGESRHARYPWKYIARHRVYNNRFLEQFVRSRASAGRLLLHIVVRDLMTWVPVQDIAIGMYHPNARGIRQMERPEPKEEKSRDVWMAIRKRTGQVCAVDTLLGRGQSIERIATKGPLGNKRKISNVNMRAVFGEDPPVHTLFVEESELYERVLSAMESNEKQRAPALVLLEEFMMVE